MARHTFEGFLIKSFGVGRDTFNPIFKVKRYNFDLATPSAESPDKGSSLCLFAPTVYSFTSLRAYFYRILAYIEDQVRHAASWTEQLLDS